MLVEINFIGRQKINTIQNIIDFGPTISLGRGEFQIFKNKKNFVWNFKLKKNLSKIKQDS